MIIKELLERTQKERLADIAKNHLTIGEKPARNALKAAGCYSISGKRGWYYEGNPATLEKSIYDFTHGERKHKPTNEPTLIPSKEITHTSTIEQTIIQRKRASFDIDAVLLKRLKLHCVENDLNLYEVAEAAMRDYLERQY